MISHLNNDDVMRIMSIKKPSYLGGNGKYHIAMASLLPVSGASINVIVLPPRAAGIAILSTTRCSFVCHAQSRQTDNSKDGRSESPSLLTTRRAALSLAAAAMLASPCTARGDEWSPTSLTLAAAADTQAGSDASSNPLIQGASLELHGSVV